MVRPARRTECPTKELPQLPHHAASRVEHTNSNEDKVPRDASHGSSRTYKAAASKLEEGAAGESSLAH